MTLFQILLTVILIALIFLTARQESRHRKLHFLVALALLIGLTPLFGYFVVCLFPKRVKYLCTYCGNAENETSRCGLCGQQIDMSSFTS
ncbi:MAG: hypothetical protein HWD58_00645 [Bacteroidota bacterium]|nr:MAG: hypothetical protein HWD58_00645 [Bacteroidota bacterium]